MTGSGQRQAGQAGFRRAPSVRSQVYDVIRAAIVSLDFTPGQALSENELSQAYGVSRTPVREALIRLADERLVEVVSQLGTFVSRINVADVRESQFIREALERSALPDAVSRATAEDGTRLREILDQQRDAAAGGDLNRWFALDEDLHRTLLETARHPRVWPVVQSAKAHLDRVRRLSLPEPAALDELHGQHTRIVDGVLAGDLAAADAVLTEHLRLVLDFVVVSEGRYPDYFQPDGDQPRPRRRPGR